MIPTIRNNINVLSLVVTITLFIACSGKTKFTSLSDQPPQLPEENVGAMPATPAELTCEVLALNSHIHPRLDPEVRLALKTNRPVHEVSVNGKDVALKGSEISLVTAEIIGETDPSLSDSQLKQSSLQVSVGSTDGKKAECSTSIVLVRLGVTLTINEAHPALVDPVGASRAGWLQHRILVSNLFPEEAIEGVVLPDLSSDLRLAGCTRIGERSENAENGLGTEEWLCASVFRAHESHALRYTGIRHQVTFSRVGDEDKSISRFIIPADICISQGGEDTCSVEGALLIGPIESGRSASDVIAGTVLYPQELPTDDALQASAEYTAIIAGAGLPTP